MPTTTDHRRRRKVRGDCHATRQTGRQTETRLATGERETYAAVVHLCRQFNTSDECDIQYAGGRRLVESVSRAQKRATAAAAAAGRDERVLRAAVDTRRDRRRARSDPTRDLLCPGSLCRSRSTQSPCAVRAVSRDAVAPAGRRGHLALDLSTARAGRNAAQCVTRREQAAVYAPKCDGIGGPSLMYQKKTGKDKRSARASATRGPKQPLPYREYGRSQCVTWSVCLPLSFCTGTKLYCLMTDATWCEKVA